MDNQQFTQYIQDKLDNLQALPLKDRPDNFAKQVELLTTAWKIMTHGSGPARRRFKRDYCRRMGL